MNFLSTFIVVTNSSANFSCSWSCQVLPDRREARLQRRRARLHLLVEALQLLGEAPHFLRIHDRLSHMKGDLVKIDPAPAVAISAMHSDSRRAMPVAMAP